MILQSLIAKMESDLEERQRQEFSCGTDYEENEGYMSATSWWKRDLEERQQELKKELQDRINGYDTCVIYDESECALEANQAERRALQNLLWEWFGH